MLNIKCYSSVIVPLIGDKIVKVKAYLEVLSCYDMKAVRVVHFFLNTGRFYFLIFWVAEWYLLK